MESNWRQNLNRYGLNNYTAYSTGIRINLCAYDLTLARPFTPFSVSDTNAQCLAWVTLPGMEEYLYSLWNFFKQPGVNFPYGRDVLPDQPV